MESRLFLKMLKRIIHDTRTKVEARFNPQSFTRNRKLPFADIVCLLMDMQKTALQARLNHFFAKTGQEVSMTEQALSKARNQFDHSPFEKMLRSVVAEEYSGNSTPKWKGYHLVAVDGSSAQVPDTAETREYFGALGRNGGHACVGLSILYDVENTWVLNPIFTVAAMDERGNLLKHISFLSDRFPHIAENALILLDRGYQSTKVFEALEQAGMKYICRCSRCFLSSVNKAPHGDSVIEQDGRRLRVYKFLLKTGEEETLITNLFDADCSDFPELYAKRWGIETAYGTLKNKLCVESFSGKTVNTVLQDLWASMVLMNLVATLRDEANQAVKAARERKPNKHEYATNTGALIVSLRDEFIFCCLRKNSYLGSLRLNKLISMISRSVLPVRPGRTSPRPPHNKEKKRFPINSKSRLA